MESSNNENVNSTSKNNTNKILIAICILLLLIIGLIVYLFVIRKPAADSQAGLVVADGEDWDGSMPINGKNSEANVDSIEIPGYSDLYASKANPDIMLINPVNNTVYMVYTIMDGDKEIFKTDAILPGKAVKAPLGTLLDLGSHDLTFGISCYDVDTQAACNGANQSVKVTIE